MRKRFGVTYDKEFRSREMFATVTGEMADGTKVWTECNTDRQLINMDKQYTMQTRGGWTEFIPL